MRKDCKREQTRRVHRSTWGIRIAAATASMLVMAFLPPVSGQSSPQSSAYRVWAADQNGNVIYVLDRDGNTIRTLNFAESAKADRPHLVIPSLDRKLVFSANTVSNSVSVHDAASGGIIAVISSVGKSPHAAQPHPKDPNVVYVANIGPQANDAGGKPDRGETITELVREDGQWKMGRLLDLKAASALADNAKFPSRRPVLFGFSSNSRYLVATLLTGGLAVVDLHSWSVVKGFGSDLVRPNATMVLPSPDQRELFVTAGSEKESWLYVLDVTGEPTIVASHNLSSLGQDAHGAALDPVRRELWIAHRVSSNITIHPVQTLRNQDHKPAVIDAGAKAPDIIEISPDGQRAYLTLRGPKPAPTIPFALAGESPGIVIVDVPARKFLKVVKLGDPQTGDFHGLAILPEPPA